MKTEERQVSNRTSKLAVAAGGILAVAGLVGSTSLAFAQQQSSGGQARASGWFKTCAERGGSELCNVQFRVVTANGVNITTLNLVESKGDAKRRVFQIVVPTGRSLPQGIQIQVDGKRAAAIPYLYCRPQGCTAEVRLDDSLVGIFKKGGKLDVTTINFQGKEQPVPVTLKGFTSAYDGPPVKRDEQTQRQQDLAEELRKKAEEKRKKEEGSD